MYGEESIVEIRISPQQADELMSRLVDDQEFRERLTQNPVEELAGYGINVPSALLPERVELPSPEEISRVRAGAEADEFAQFPVDGGFMGKFGPLWCALIWFIKFKRLPRA
jgi:putative modified peptide